MDRFDPFVKYADVYGDIINWEKDPMNKPQNQNKYFFSDGKTYYEQICKMLRLMSVFKEAFNQIYSNEDEISEAWENFVNNLSASVVEGSEPDVTLTWTDDSVNFEFTMVPGVPGEQGVGITSISFNSDYTMTITLSDGNTYTSMSLKGETGPQGPQGETGSGLQILDVYATLPDLQSAHPTGQPGDAYQVGSAGNYTLYIWSSSQSAWVPAGSLGTVSPSVSNPLMDGTASAGSSNLYSRGDHVHPTDTSRASKEELDALIKTSQTLIDQSFIYRESPAIQDGLARIDKIKGNTLKWNQLTSTLPQTQEYDYGLTFTNNEDGSLTINGTSTNTGVRHPAVISGLSNIEWLTTHIYLINFANPTMTLSIRPASAYTFENGTLTNGIGIFKPNSDIVGGLVIRINANSSMVFDNYRIYPQVFDLTNMFGSTLANAIYAMEQSQVGSGVAYFKSLFPLDFYAYNQGTLLSFNGSGIKTVGKNQLNPNDAVGLIGSVSYSDDTYTITYSSSGDRYVGMNFYRRGIPLDKLLPKKYTLSFDISGVTTTWAIGLRNATNNSFLNSAVISVTRDGHYSLTIDLENNNQTEYYLSFVRTGNQTSALTVRISNVMLETGETETSYEPYASSTLSLPISTYFPNGMKSAGTAYDELIPTKATTRISRVDLGSLVWTLRDNTYWQTQSDAIPDAKKPSDNVQPINAIHSVYEVKGGYYVQGTNQIGMTTTGVLNCNNGSTTDKPSGYLYYELATPVENAIDLDLDFMAYADGTEQLLPVNGSVPSTSPILADISYLSIDDAMEYIIDKLANVPQNTQQILESLEDDVADIQTDTGNLQTAVSGLQTSVGNINTNIGQLSSTVAGHTASISDMQSDITDLNTGLSNLEDTVTDNTSRIGTLETGLSTTNGNVQSLSSQVQSIDGRVTNLETDLLIVVKKEYDYDSVAGNTNFGVQTGLSQEPGYKIIGIVGSEVQQGEYTSAEPWIIVTQAHVHYTSTGGVVLSMMARNVSEYTKTNVRVYLYLLCIKDTQSQ